MHDREAIQMMQRCREEIIHLRHEIDRLSPKADAYDKLSIVLDLLPRPSVSMGEDLAWTLEREIAKAEARVKAATEAPDNG